MESISHDFCREGFTTSKLRHYFQTLLKDNLTQALVYYPKFADIDITQLKRLDIGGIILDVDECIAPHHGHVLSENIIKLKEFIENGFEILIYSNMKDNGRYAELEDIGIKVFRVNHAKPDPRGFEMAMKAMGFDEPSKVVMIGDNFATDGGCISAGIRLIKIDPILTRDGFKLKRFVQKISRNLLDMICLIRGNKLKYGKFRD